MAASRIILGCGNFGGIGSAPEFFGQGESDDEAHRLMDAAWELGIRSFDTADAYGGGRSETWIGRWLAETGNEPVLTTKVFHSVEGDPSDRGFERPAPKRITRCSSRSEPALRSIVTRSAAVSPFSRTASTASSEVTNPRTWRFSQHSARPATHVGSAA